MAIRPSRAAREEAANWRLAFRERTVGGSAGRHLARTSGSSLEFQDRRAYQPGDDLRHLDWRAWARTDQLLVKVHREEVQPRFELLVDASRSMAIEESKVALTVDLAFLLADAARAEGLEPRCILLSDAPRRLEPDQLERGLELDARARLEDALREARPLLRPGSLRALLSDFLTPHDARNLLRPLASGAGGLALVQLLGPSDAEPPVGEALRLVDAETEETLDLVLDASAIAAYRARLSRLSAELETECRRHAALFARLVAGPGLGELCRTTLEPAGILTPA